METIVSMSDQEQPFQSHDAAPGNDPPQVYPAPSWLIDFRMSAHRKGFYQSADSYGIVFSDRDSDTLVVSFDNLSSARDDALDREPWGYGFVAKNGWSQLGVMTFEATWFRDDALFAYLQDLAASGFFKRFRRITMTGTSMGGYAACAFASLAPGCSVIAFSPQSTLKKDLVPWEERFASGRKADWSGPFADAAEESKAAGKVYLVYDPEFEPDVRHVERFIHPNAIPLKARYSGHKSALFLRRAGLLSTVVRETITDEMSPARFYSIYRGGRNLPWFINALAKRLQETGRHRLLPRLAAAAGDAGLANVAKSISSRAEAAGIEVPDLTRASETGQHEAKPVAKQLYSDPAPEKPADPQPTARPQPARKTSRVPDPEPVADLYMIGEDLPPPVSGASSPWVQSRSRENSGPPLTPWQRRRETDNAC